MKLFAAIAAVATAQQIGRNTNESHLRLSYQECSNGSCNTQQGQVVLDANWRWVHNTGGYTNCYQGNTWSS